ncbi:MAG: methylated-DNA--[protein]-cysteine S-methyltransferase [Betaproteobacteria bacterium]|jgi:methylated-DNA-[protein]-cysteine S-methyltransferase|nr:methylated-DNA--[protein]-cysteine S-methyltransferase [Betaproteobacteria bacterium]
MRSYDTYDSPQGRMLLVADDDGLSGVYFEKQKHFGGREKNWRHDPHHPVLARAKRELAEFFAGKRRRFDLPLAPSGTPFQKAVWKAISTIGYGETISYGELARRAGVPGSARAAGAATGRNPIGIIVPCHRVVGANGSLTGYAGGLGRKKALLALERGERDLLSAA